ncbi:3'-5' exonuclease [Kiritimatiellaeota bacterium B1221]|nr:3'-5' exonuclease [Kiritimatiellaeota bacterium B1221]
MQFPFSFTAIDFETTGSVAGYPVEPWQVGLVSFSPGEKPVFWESLLQVGPRPFHPRAPGRHAQLREALAEAPRLEECLPVLRTYCSSKPLLAHNVATEKKCFRQSVPMEKFGPWVDTLKLSRAAWPHLTSHKLEDVLVALDLMNEMQNQFPDRGAHDALYDAYGSGLILLHLFSLDEWKEVPLDLWVNPDLSRWHRR